MELNAHVRQNCSWSTYNEALYAKLGPNHTTEQHVNPRVVMATGTTNAEITTVHTSGKWTTRERANWRDKIASSEEKWQWDLNHWSYYIISNALGQIFIFVIIPRHDPWSAGRKAGASLWKSLAELDSRSDVCRWDEVDEVRRLPPVGGRGCALQQPGNNACLMGSGVSNWSYIQNLRPASWIHTFGGALTSHCTETTYKRHLLASKYILQHCARL